MRNDRNGTVPLLAVFGILQVVLILCVWCWVAVKCKFLYWDNGPPLEMLLIRDHGWILFALPAVWAAWCLQRAGSVRHAGEDPLARRVGLALVFAIPVAGFFTSL